MYMQHILTIESSLEEKIQEARRIFLQNKQFSPSRLNAWNYSLNPPSHCDKGLPPTDEQLLNALLYLNPIDAESRRKMDCGFKLENAIATVLRKELPNKGYSINDLDRLNAKPVIEHLTANAKANTLDSSWIIQQQKIQFTLDVPCFSEGVVVSGFVDMVFGNTLFDFKYTEAPYVDGKYRNSLQHKCYLASLGEEREDFKFEYLIVKGGKDYIKPEATLFVENYRWNEQYLQDITNCINEIVCFVRKDDALFVADERTNNEVESQQQVKQGSIST